MAFMIWDESFSVKVKEIDEQHKGLIEAINDFYEKVCANHPKEAMHEVLATLTEYAATHFATEEKYFDQFSYEYTDEHKEEHAGFVVTVLEKRQRFAEEKMVLPTEIAEFLKKWIVDHISSSDKKYSKCFNDNGLS